jgi:hypothetical protein
MKHKTLLLVLARLAIGTAVAVEAKITPRLSKELKGSCDKEGSMFIVGSVAARFRTGKADFCLQTESKTCGIWPQRVSGSRLRITGGSIRCT